MPVLNNNAAIPAFAIGPKEVELLLAYRDCGPEERETIRLFVDEMRALRSAPLPNNVIPIRRA